MRQKSFFKIFLLSGIILFFLFTGFLKENPGPPILLLTGHTNFSEMKSP
jgi:hypothetical protein